MDPKIRTRERPEGIIEDALKIFLRARCWYVKKMHSTAFMPGVPDLFCVHKDLGTKWVEVKDPLRKGDVFTPAQKKEFPLMSAHGANIYVLTAATVAEYKKLFEHPNWIWFLQGLR